MTETPDTKSAGSQRFALCQADLKKVGKGAIATTSTAMLTYAANAMTAEGAGCWTIAFAVGVMAFGHVLALFCSDTNATQQPPSV
jgi:hypothetical protein